MSNCILHKEDLTSRWIMVKLMGSTGPEPYVGEVI